MNRSSWFVALPIAALLIACAANGDDENVSGGGGGGGAAVVDDGTTGHVTQALPKEDPGGGNWEPPINGNFTPVPESYFFTSLTCPYYAKPYMCCNHPYDTVCHCSAYYCG